MSSESNALPLTGLRPPATDGKAAPDPEMLVRRAEQLRRGLTGNFRDEAVTSIYAEAERIARRAARPIGNGRGNRP